MIQAENVQDFDFSFSISKVNLQKIVKLASESRSIIQKLESQILQYSQQKNIILEYNKIRKNKKLVPDNKFVPTCPNCGYVMNEEIYNIVQNQYAITNEEFIVNQIDFLINKTNKELNTEKEKYIKITKELTLEEEKISKQENKFELYTRFKGLISTIKHLESEINDLSNRKAYLENENKQLEKEKKKKVNKKDIEEKYAQNLYHDLMDLGAWNEQFSKKIKISQPLKAQGTLSSKIILSQYTALFKTMNNIAGEKDNNIIRFPFVIDSPRTKEASKLSSKEILNLLLNIKSLPQMIIVTVDFQDYINTSEQVNDINVISFSTPFKLLNHRDYESNEIEICNFYRLLRNYS